MLTFFLGQICDKQTQPVRDGAVSVQGEAEGSAWILGSNLYMSGTLLPGIYINLLQNFVVRSQWP
jgi:hypothetical protein